MKKYIFLIIIILVLIIIFYNTDDNSIVDKYFEEAIPIFHDDKINGLIYRIVINEDTNDSRLVIYPKIYNSIYHFKDINSIDNFNININIDNNSNNKYVIKSINYFNKKTFNYNDIIDNSNNNSYYYVVNKDLLLNRSSDDVKIIFEKK